MLHYVVSDYLATGEGSTVCVLVTMAYPDAEDYEDDESHMDPDGAFHFVMPKLKEGVTPEKIALREFKKEFGNYFSIGAEIVTEEEFKKRWIRHCPAYIEKIINNQKDETLAAGNVYYASKFHINYS